MTVLAADSGISLATGYRYLHEGIDALAAQAPDLHEVLERGKAAGWTHVTVDGTLIRTDRCRTKNPDTGHDLWFSGKHHTHGGNVQVIFDPTGFPLWVSDVRPGSMHDLTAAHELVLPALYPHAARGLPGAGRQGLHRRRHRRARSGPPPARWAAAHRQPLLQPADQIGRPSCRE